MEQEYFVGLDIGTDSVGWAVTDPEYRLKKHHGKQLWGVRLFDSAEPAQERRMYRTGRRLNERRRRRLKWLQEIFSDEIGKVDPAFFQRLKESRFLEVDKEGTFERKRYCLFGDPAYTDKQYHQQYPTIYHLRKELICNKAPHDVRLVYLAVHHIMKHRGHFLYGDLDLSAISLQSGLDRLSRASQEEWDEQIPAVDTEVLKQILTDKKCNKTEKRKKMYALFQISDKKSSMAALSDLLIGSKVSLDLLYQNTVSTEDIQKLSLEEDFEEYEEKLTAALGDRIELILAAKEIYDWALLEEILNGNENISFAKAENYEKHKQDLARLKAAVKKTENPDLYKKIFHQAADKQDNYPAYSGKGAANYRCDYDKFRKYIKKKLNSYQEQVSDIADILAELDNGTFLPKQSTKDNSVIPHQLHEKELMQILQNASEYLPFLKEADNNGLSKAEQIHQMFCFRIPYYVGPLDSRSEHSWVVRKNEKIYPWNFDRVVDLEESRKHFITRMTAKCSYIGEDVLPKDSLLYSKFTVLNELNNLKINGKKISVPLKQQIYRELFLSGKKVTAKKLKDFLNSEGILQPDDTLGGFDGDFKATLAPWAHFAWLTGREGGEHIAEEIITHIVLFGEDKKLLRGWLKKTYGNLLNEEEQKKALSVRYSGWGRLSKIFLTQLYHVDEQTGESFSILDMLWNTNDNLMELLSSRYQFAERVEQYRAKKTSEYGMTLQEYLDESYASPGIKRAIRQTLAIIGEIQSFFKTPPKRIFVEMAREEEEIKKRTVSRKDALIQLYQKCGEECGELFERLTDEPEGNLRRDRLYLYYTQLGRCMYSGESIDINRLESDYDIDHIYPQSKTKDDSMDNRVLVKRQLNAQKTDVYPIHPDIRKQMRAFWTMLRGKGLISVKKYERLIRSTPFTLEEQAGFINRQLVETRQSSKIIAELLKRKFADRTEIVYVKAGNVSDFRQDQRLTENGVQKQAGNCKNERTTQDPLFVKCREINDMHHAKDAYLNIVAGNVYHLKFTRSPINFLKSAHAKYSLNHMFDYPVERNGERAWTAGEDGSIRIVRETMRKNNVLMTRRTAPEKGGLFDQQIVSKGKGQTPIKSSDKRLTIEHYGGYNSVKGTYFILAEHTLKKKRVRSIEPVLLMHKTRYETDPVGYCTEILQLQDPAVLLPRININSLFSFDGFRMNLSGRTGDDLRFKNANPLVLAPMWQAYIKNLSKYAERCRAAGRDLTITRFDGIGDEQNRQLYKILRGKLTDTKYRICLESAAKTLTEQTEKFATFPCAEQCRILLQILNIFSNSARTANLEALGGSKSTGILRLSKNIGNSQGHSLLLIHQSVTGVYEQEVDLLETDGQ